MAMVVDLAIGVCFINLAMVWRCFGIVGEIGWFLLVV